MDLTNYTPSPQPPVVWYQKAWKGAPARISLEQPVHRPAAPCGLTYLNEGGANFVFKLHPQDCQERSMQVQGRAPLLRIRKNLSHALTADEQRKAFRQHFEPLFPWMHLVMYNRVALGEGFIRMLNEILNKAQRPARRQDDALAEDEEFGLLVDDMSPNPGEKLYQFKPKWLTQSPNAPQGSKRCRTCALRAQRAAQQQRTATDAQEACPLALVSQDIEDRKRYAETVTADEADRGRIAVTLQPILGRLREQQERLDPCGVLNVNEEDAAAVLDVCKAMTLRDCTMFMNVPQRGGFQAKLGDLDLKQPEKLEKWRSIERSLIDEGWYANEERGDAWAKEEVCLLSR